jgi:hypothetical protein
VRGTADPQSKGLRVATRKAKLRRKLLPCALWEGGLGRDVGRE